MRERPGRERVGAEALVHQRERRLDVRIGQIREHRRDLIRRQHALVDQRLRRQAGDVEDAAARRASQRVDRVLDALADHVQLPLERRIGLAASPIAASPPRADEHLLEDRLGRDGATPRARGRRSGTSRQPSSRCPSSATIRSISASTVRALARVARQEDEAGAVLRRPAAGRCRARAATLRRNAIRHLDQDAGAVAGVRLAAARAAMLQVDEQLQALLDDRVRTSALDVDDEPDAARVVLRIADRESPVACGGSADAVRLWRYRRRRRQKGNRIITSDP